MVVSSLPSETVVGVVWDASEEASVVLSEAQVV